MKKIFSIFFILLFSFGQNNLLASDLSPSKNHKKIKKTSSQYTERVKSDKLENQRFRLGKVSKMIIFLFVILNLMTPVAPFSLASIGIVFNPQVYHERPSWAQINISNTSATNLSHDNVTESYYFDKENVFGQDNRIKVNSKNFPFSGIGKIIYKNSKGSSYACTGELISREHILTNAHCVFEDEKDSTSGRLHRRFISSNWEKTFRFHPAYSDGYSRDSAGWKAIAFSKKYEDLTHEAWEQDWAIIHLDKALGDYFSKFVLEEMSYEEYKDFNQKINLVGYSGDKYSDSPGGHFDCSLSGVVNYNFGKQITHNCDSTKGSSGSGLYFIDDGANDSKVAKIVAIHHASIVLSNGGQQAPDFSYSTANLACETKEAFDAFQFFKNHTDVNPPYDGPKDDKLRENIFYYTIGVGGGLFVLTCACLTLKKSCKGKIEEVDPHFNYQEEQQTADTVVEIDV